MNLLVLLLGSALAASSIPSTSQLDAFLNRVQRTPADQRSAAIEEALARRPDLPWVEGQEVLFLAARRNGQAPRLIGDFNSWGRIEGRLAATMTPIKGTSYYYARGQFESQARIDYQFQYGEEAVPDPANPHRWERWGEVTSELQMPGYQPPQELRELPQVPAGRLIEHDFKSQALKGQRHVYVYLPPGYGQSEERYPSVYFGDGDGWVNEMQTPRILEGAIRSGRLPKLIAIFHQPQNRGREYRRHPGHRRFLAQELVAWVDGQFRTYAQADQRVVLGASRGGLMAADVALTHPQVFGLCAPVAPAIRPTALLEDLRELSPSGVRFSVAYGSYDLRFLPDALDLVEILKQRGWPLHVTEFPQGHSIRAWRPVIGDVLRPLLGSD
ncbi:MAG TPA: alpha/beta hydrolase-fold protein [Acidobacteriota bacterium]|nr:alpha/beta hydrolase-fold protein [Acidobacteriota bacterium]